MVLCDVQWLNRRPGREVAFTEAAACGEGLKSTGSGRNTGYFVFSFFLDVCAQVCASKACQFAMARLSLSKNATVLPTFDWEGNAVLPGLALFAPLFRGRLCAARKGPCQSRVPVGPSLCRVRQSSPSVVDRGEDQGTDGEEKRRRALEKRFGTTK
jgi:hypothetical protein